MKKVAVSLILMLQCSGLALYHWRMEHDPNGYFWHQYKWTVIFDCSWSLPYSLLQLVFAVTDDSDRSIFDKQFLTIGGLMSLILTISYVLDYFGIIKHTYGFMIAIFGTFCVTTMIIISMVQHGYYKNKNEDD